MECTGCAWLAADDEPNASTTTPVNGSAPNQQDGVCWHVDVDAIETKAEPTTLSATDVEKGGPPELTRLPQLKITVLASLFYTFMTPLVLLGNRRPLMEGDLPTLPDGETVAGNGAKLVRCWMTAECKGTAQARLHRTLRAFLSPEFERSVCVPLLNIGVSVLQPFLLLRFVAFLRRDGSFSLEGVASAILLAVSAVAVSVTMQMTFFNAISFGLRMKGAITYLVFGSALQLGPRAFLHTTVGAIVNIVSVDCAKMQQTCATLPFVWWSPLYLAALAVCIIVLAGPAAALPGLATVFLVSWPTIVCSARWNGAKRQVQMRHNDARVRTANEIVQGIAAVKFNAWEPAMRRLVEEHRSHEHAALTKMCFVQNLVGLLMVVLPGVGLCVTLATARALGGDHVPGFDAAFAIMLLYAQSVKPIEVRAMCVCVKGRQIRI